MIGMRKERYSSFDTIGNKGTLFSPEFTYKTYGWDWTLQRLVSVRGGGGGKGETHIFYFH